ncbi:hypothetical protein HOC35_00925 [Candidatus Woesearchaeota archaeon]|nr:hypothetical protein [Candidatus Woesearchaeota archaeon]
MNKKSQITAFIIVGLVLVIIIATTSYIKQIGEPRQDYKKLYEVTSSVKPVRTYVEKCLQDIGTFTIHNISTHGGSLNLNEFQYLENEKINYMCIYEQEIGCRNKLLFRQDIEAEISEEINKKIIECVDLNIFRDQGFIVSTETPEVKTKIKNYEVVLSLKYPIHLEKNKLKLEVTSFTTKVDLPLGILLKTSVNIVNDELQELNFNAPEFMQDHADILIQKFKPYPDVIYRLKKDELVFQFALKTKNTISEPNYNFFGVNENNNGCCYNPEDNFCYQNALKENCEQKKGIYSEECTCNKIEYNTILKLNPTLDCKKTYDRTGNKYSSFSRSNGESWCSYEKLGEENKALSGSRHYLHYCIDGVEYKEPCRDYREEICTETSEIDLFGDTIKKAQCRSNRFQDCIDCNDQECCEDVEVRDCSWLNLKTEKKCVPKVAPGLKFWELTALATCTKANEQKECVGSSFSCPEKWVDDTAKLCYLQGDCGNGRNVKQVLTRYGFINTDLKYKPNKNIYNINKNITEKTISETLDLKYDTKKRATITSTTYSELYNSHVELLSSGLNYLNEMSSISVTDFINPFKEKPIMRILDVSLCSSWQPPRLKQDCSYCTRSDFRECSEYLCKSLGQQCIFDYSHGDPICNRIKHDDKKPPEISLNNNAVTENHEIKSIVFTAGSKNIKGYKITPALLPHKQFLLGITADEPVTCKLALMPFKGFNDLSGIYFGQQSFEIEHNLSLKVPPKVAIPQNIIDMFNVTNFEEFAEIIEEPEEIVNSYKEKFKFHISLYNTFTGSDIATLIDPIVDKVNKYLKIIKGETPFVKTMVEYSLNKFENNTYVVYLKCMDEAGNENTDPLFIEFSIQEKNLEQDNTATKLIGSIPENNSIISNDANELDFSIYLNEPAECKYDFVDKDYEEMEHTFSCSKQDYQLSSKFGGSYECTSKLNTTNDKTTDKISDKTTIFIRCKDKPFSIEEYHFYVEENNHNGVEELTPGMFFNVTDPNIIYTSLFENKHLKFTIDNSQNNNSVIELHLFKDNLDSCSYSFGTYQNKLDQCSKTNQLHLGVYECIETIDLNKGKIEKIYDIEFSNSDTTNNENIELMINIIDLENNKIIVPSTEKNISLTTIFDKPHACSLINVNKIKTDMKCDEDTYSCFAKLNQTIKTINCMEKNYLHNISFKCANKEVSGQNINQESFIYTIKKSSGFEITETQPNGEVTITNPKLKIKTSNNNVKCRYKQDFGLSYINLIREDLDDGIWFTTQLSELQENLNSFKVRCVDDYGNQAEEDIEFYVIT